MSSQDSSINIEVAFGSLSQRLNLIGGAKIFGQILECSIETSLSAFLADNEGLFLKLELVMQLVSLKGAEEATLVAHCIRGSVVRRPPSISVWTSQRTYTAFLNMESEMMRVVLSVGHEDHFS